MSIFGCPCPLYWKRTRGKIKDGSGGFPFVPEQSAVSIFSIKVVVVVVVVIIIIIKVVAVVAMVAVVIIIVIMMIIFLNCCHIYTEFSQIMILAVVINTCFSK